jgi:hypothetical protein
MLLLPSFIHSYIFDRRLLLPSFMGREHGTKIEELVGWESFRMPQNSKNMCIQKGFVNTQNHHFKVLMVAS